MSRPLRIEYPGAWYHVMNRGGRYEAIFKDKKEFGLKKDSPAGSIFDRAKKQILRDKQFRNKVAGIKKIINKS
jgi:hypothetical protein